MKLPLFGTAVFAMLLSSCLFPRSPLEKKVQRPGPEDQIAFTTLNEGLFSQINEPDQVIVQDEDHWEDLWKRLNAHQLTPYPLPPVDFHKEVVVALFMGAEPSGGYSIEVQDVFKTTKNVVVRAAEIRPDEGCINESSVTAPFHVIKFSKTKQPILFDIQKQEHQCP